MKPRPLVAGIIGLAIPSFYAEMHWGLEISILSLSLLILFTIDQWLWKHPPFSLLYTVPDISGEYEGELISNYGVAEGQGPTHFPQTRTIRQTGSSLHITTRTNGTSTSQTLSLEFNTAHTEVPTIYHTYQNEGNRTLTGFPVHYGTEILRFEKDSDGLWRIEGSYYTNRNPQTMGEILLKQRKPSK